MVSWVPATRLAAGAAAAGAAAGGAAAAAGGAAGATVNSLESVQSSDALRLPWENSKYRTNAADFCLH